MATVLNKELKRQVTVDGVDYVVALQPEGLKVTGRGKRKPEVQLLWRDLLNGDAALATALNASLSTEPTVRPDGKRPPEAARKRAIKKPGRST